VRKPSSLIISCRNSKKQRFSWQDVQLEHLQDLPSAGFTVIGAKQEGWTSTISPHSLRFAWGSINSPDGHTLGG
jgi:hypothetical protein